MKRYSHGTLADIHKHHGVCSLDAHMKKRAKEREAEREAAGGKKYCIFAIILSTFRLFKGQQYLNNMLRVNK